MDLFRRNSETLEANIFQLMMKYLYTDHIDLNGETVVPVLYTAQKYQVSPLVSICAKYLRDMMTVHNVCTIFSQAKLFDLLNLRTHALTFIANNASDVFDGDDFFNLSCLDLAEILQLDSLCIPEIKLFLSILRWADQKMKSKSLTMEKKKRDILLQDGILYLIAIPLLSLEDYTKYVVASGILTDEEQLYLFKAITMKQSLSPQHCLFRTLPRKWGTPVTISIDEIISSNVCKKSRCIKDNFFSNRRNNTRNIARPVATGRIMSRKMYKETIYLKASKAIRIVAVHINPKYEINDYQNPTFASKIICTALEKTVQGVLKPQSSLKLEIDIDLKLNMDLDINIEIHPMQPFSKNQQCEIQMMPFDDREDLTDDLMFQHNVNQCMIQLSFEGVYLVEGIEIMNL